MQGSETHGNILQRMLPTHPQNLMPLCIHSPPVNALKRTPDKKQELNSNLLILLTLAVKASQGWSGWSDWSPCLKTYRGCYQSKYRICFAKNLALCPGSAESGVRYKTRKCASEEECKSTLKYYYRIRIYLHWINQIFCR